LDVAFERFFFCLPATAEDDRDSHRKIAVLQAGYSGGSREAVFTDFLEKHFDRTGKIPLRRLSMETAKGYDVVIVDWKSYYGSDGYEKGGNADPVDLGPEFTKPFIAMTYAGTRVRKNYKLDWIVERLTADPDDALAKRLAKRYLGEHADDAVAFVRANRRLLFFSDTGGYRWFVDENAKRAAAVLR